MGSMRCRTGSCCAFALTSVIFDLFLSWFHCFACVLVNIFVGFCLNLDFWLLWRSAICQEYGIHK